MFNTFEKLDGFYEGISPCLTLSLIPFTLVATHVYYMVHVTIKRY